MSRARQRRRLVAGLAKLGIEELDGTADRLLDFADLLLAGNRQTNLVSVGGVDELITHHFLDSLVVLKEVSLRAPVIDVGSGAGLPGIPVAIAAAVRPVLLVEPRAKRAQFLETAVRELRLKDVTVEKSSAEAARPGWSSKAGTVLMRAVAKPERALALGIPLLRDGGKLVLYIGRASAPTEQDLGIAGRLGSRLSFARRVTVPFLNAERHLWVFEKAPTGRRPPRGGKTNARRVSGSRRSSTLRVASVSRGT